MKKYKLPIVLIINLFLLSSCYHESDFKETNFNFDSLVSSVDIEKETLLADGIDQSKIQIFINPELNIDSLNFTATLSKGLFRENLNDSISLQSEYEVDNLTKSVRSIRFTVLAPLEVAESVLKLRLNTYTKNFDLNFERSYPERIEIVAAPRVFSRKRVENVELQTTLKKQTGKPSLGTNISFMATDSLGNPIGKIVSDCDLTVNSSNCTSFFNIWPDTTYIGKINIKANISNDTQDLSEEISLFTLE